MSKRAVRRSKAQRVSKHLRTQRDNKGIPRQKVAAQVIIHDAAKMNRRGREQIALFLVRQAATLLEHADQLDAKFLARYWYERFD